MDAPILSMLGVYFRKKRSFASGVAFTGSSIGTVVLPPVIAFCISEFTVRGALLIFGGLWLHTLLVGAVMRPIPRPSDLVKSTPKETSPIYKPSKLDHHHGDLDRNGDAEHDCFLPPGEPRKAEPLIMEQHTTVCLLSLKQIIRDNLDFLSTRKLLPLSFMFICLAFAYFNQFFILPPLVEELGLSRMFGSLMVALPNGVEVISRLATGAVANRFSNKKHLLILTSSAFTAMCSLIVSFYLNKYTLIVYAVLFGLFGGIFIPLLIPMLFDVVKPSQIGRASGMHPILTGIGISLGPPVLGKLHSFFNINVYCCSLFRPT